MIKMLHIFKRTSKLQAKPPTLLQRENSDLKPMKFNPFFCGYLKELSHEIDFK
jgi:hypothetical protein